MERLVLSPPVSPSPGGSHSLISLANLGKRQVPQVLINGKPPSLSDASLQGPTREPSIKIPHPKVTVKLGGSLLQTLIGPSLHTLYLFTKSDLKSILYPSVLFAASTVFSTPLLLVYKPTASSTLLLQFFYAVTWILCNLLNFDIGNQRQPDAIREDSINKPWRPLPARRLDTSQALTLQVLAIGASLLVSCAVGGLSQCILLIVLSCSYNELGGGDSSIVLRYAINAAGFLSFGIGATVIAAGSSQASFTRAAYEWYAMIAVIVLTTIPTMDMYDQEGDKIRGRLTLPLVAGDEAARWILCVGVLGWSFMAPAYWELHLLHRLPMISLGWIIAMRYLKKKQVEDDKMSFKLWNLWMVLLYLLPLVKSFSTHS